MASKQRAAPHCSWQPPSLHLKPSMISSLFHMLSHGRDSTFGSDLPGFQAYGELPTPDSRSRFRSLVFSAAFCSVKSAVIPCEPLAGGTLCHDGLGTHCATPVSSCPSRPARERQVTETLLEASQLRLWELRGIPVLRLGSIHAAEHLSEQCPVLCQSLGARGAVCAFEVGSRVM